MSDMPEKMQITLSIAINTENLIGNDKAYLREHIIENSFESIRDAKEIYGLSFDYEAKSSDTRTPVWIPVSERLPEDGQYVLVGVQSRGTVMLAKYFGDGGFSVYPQKDVTHWMSLLPLPIPPLEQEKNNERYS